MAKSVVCGVSTRGTADVVADTARWLADRLGDRLVIMHAAEMQMPEGEELLEALGNRLRLGPDDVLRLVEGAPVQRIQHLVEEYDGELIVVGTRGRGAIASAVLGSVSRTLSVDARSPVVVVPPDSTPPSGESAANGSIVVGVDGSDHALNGARLSAEFGARMGYRVVVVHALAQLQSYVAYPGAAGTAPGPSAQPDTGERLARELVEAAVEAVGGDATGVVEPGLPWDVLQAVAEREDGRLLVVSARGISPTRAATLGSASMKLATSSERPVLILPEGAEPGGSPPDPYADLLKES